MDMIKILSNLKENQTHEMYLILSCLYEHSIKRMDLLSLIKHNQKYIEKFGLQHFLNSVGFLSSIGVKYELINTFLIKTL